MASTLDARPSVERESLGEDSLDFILAQITTPGSDLGKPTEEEAEQKRRKRIEAEALDRRSKAKCGPSSKARRRKTHVNFAGGVAGDDGESTSAPKSRWRGLNASTVKNLRMSVEGPKGLSMLDMIASVHQDHTKLIEAAKCRPGGRNTRQIERLVKFLKNCSRFRDFETSVVRTCARAMVCVTFEEGQDVYVQGDPAAAVYVVVDGCVSEVAQSNSSPHSVSSASPSPRLPSGTSPKQLARPPSMKPEPLQRRQSANITSRIHEKHKTFGEREIISGHPRESTVSCASEKCVLLMVHTNVFRDILNGKLSAAFKREIDLVHQLPEFRPLEDNVLAGFVLLFQQRVFGADDAILLQGPAPEDTEGTLFWILSGEVACYADPVYDFNNPEKRHLDLDPTQCLHLCNVGPGGLVGDTSLVRKGQITRSAIALTEVVTVSVSVSQIKRRFPKDVIKRLKNAASAKASYEEERCAEELERASRFLPVLKWGDSDMWVGGSAYSSTPGAERIPTSTGRRGIRADPGPEAGASSTGIPGGTEDKQKAMAYRRRVKSGFGLWRLQEQEPLNLPHWKAKQDDAPPLSTTDGRAATSGALSREEVAEQTSQHASRRPRVLPRQRSQRSTPPTASLPNLLVGSHTETALLLSQRPAPRPSRDAGPHHPLHFHEPGRQDAQAHHTTSAALHGALGRDHSSRRHVSTDRQPGLTADASKLSDGVDGECLGAVDITDELGTIEEILSDMSIHSAITWKHIALLLGGGGSAASADEHALPYTPELRTAGSGIAVGWPTEGEYRPSDDGTGAGWSGTSGGQEEPAGVYSDRPKMVSWQGHQEAAHVPAEGGRKRAHAPSAALHGNHLSPYSFPATRSSPGALEISRRKDHRGVAATVSGSMSTSEIAKGFADMKKYSQFRYLASQHSVQAMAGKDKSRAKRKGEAAGKSGDGEEETGLGKDLRGRIHAAMAAAKSVITIRNTVANAAKGQGEGGAQPQPTECEEHAGSSGQQNTGGKLRLQKSSKTKASAQTHQTPGRETEGGDEKHSGGKAVKEKQSDVALVKSWQSLAEFKANQSGHKTAARNTLNRTNLSNVKIVRC